MLITYYSFRNPNIKYKSLETLLLGDNLYLYSNIRKYWISSYMDYKQMLCVSAYWLMAVAREMCILNISKQRKLPVRAEEL